jgi:hypothetical protein
MLNRGPVQITPPKQALQPGEKTGMRRIFSQYDHPLGRLVRRLDDVALRLNPFLALAIIGLLILNFACALNLIDWRNLPETPPPLAGSGHLAAPPPADSNLSGAPSGSSAHIATTPD